MIIPQIATLHLTATLKMPMTIPEAPTTGSAIEESSSLPLLEIELLPPTLKIIASL